MWGRSDAARDRIGGHALASAATGEIVGVDHDPASREVRPYGGVRSGSGAGGLDGELHAAEGFVEGGAGAAEVEADVFSAGRAEEGAVA
jgi:hypothetical protein